MVVVVYLPIRTPRPASLSTLQRNRASRFGQQSAWRRCLAPPWKTSAPGCGIRHPTVRVVLHSAKGRHQLEIGRDISIGGCTAYLQRKKVLEASEDPPSVGFVRSVGGLGGPFPHPITGVGKQVVSTDTSYELDLTEQYQVLRESLPQLTFSAWCTSLLAMETHSLSCTALWP